MDTRPAPPYIFVSYASADRERVLPVVAALERAGVGAWIDRKGIHGGANYAREIAEAIKGAAAFVLMASALSLASRNVKQEIAVGWEYERPYLPLLLERVTIPDDVKYWLTAAQWVEVLDTPEAAWLPQVLTALAPLGIAPAPAPPEAIRLAGRERELALLRDKLVAATGGTGGLALIGGEAGIGKTTLAVAALHEAGQRGFIVLEGHCFDLAETPPYGPWIDLFAHYTPSRSSPPLPPAFTERGTVGAVSSQMALFVAVEDFLTALAVRQPIVVLLDDLHWSDVASLDLLRFLARSVAALPLLILVTYRSDELTRKHPLYGLLPQLARDASAARIDLGRLDDEAVRALVDTRYRLPDADSQRLVAYLQGRAEGNALFVGELLRSLEEADNLHQGGGGWLLRDVGATAVPALLRQVIDGRLGRLGDENRRLLSVAAVIGHDVPLDVWAAVGEADEDALLDLTERAEEANLLLGTADGTGVRFAHALIREALYEGIPSMRRRRLHLRAGEALAKTRNPDPDAVAMHFQRAGDRRAVPWLVKAGERAQLAYAWLTAIERYEAALALLDAGDGDLADHAWLLVRLGVAHRATDPRRGVTYLEEAERAAATLDEPTLRAATTYLLGNVHAFAADIARGLALMEAGIAALEALSPDERARIESLLTLTLDKARASFALYLAMSGRYAAALACSEPELAGGTQSGRLFVALALAYGALGRPGDADGAFRRAREAERSAGDVQQVATICHAHTTLVALPYRADDAETLEELAAEGERALAAGERLGFETRPPPFARVPLFVLRGRWEEVARLVEDVHPRDTSSSAQLLRALGAFVCARGERDLAWQWVHEALPFGSGTEPGGVNISAVFPMLRVAADLAIAERDLTAARAWLEAYDRWLAWSGAVLGQSERQALWAQYHRQAGDDQQAYEHAERALAHATEPRQPLALIAAHRLLGELDTAAGRYDDAAALLDASVALADACQAPYERALTLLAMADLRAAQGASDEAHRLFDAVKAICTPLGAKPALARADVLAARLTSG